MEKNDFGKPSWENSILEKPVFEKTILEKPMVGWFAGWLAGWLAGSCRGSVLGRDMPTMDIHGEDISTIDRDVGGERFTQNGFSKAFSTQWSGF